MMYPSNAQTPIQYQFRSTNMPRASRTCMPSVLLLAVILTTCTKNVIFLSILAVHRLMRPVLLEKMLHYLLPAMAKKLVHCHGILCIHKRGGPVAPNPPVFYVVCRKENSTLCSWCCGAASNLFNEKKKHTTIYQEASKNQHKNLSECPKCICNNHLPSQCRS